MMSLAIDLASLRLRNQKLARSNLSTPVDVVAWLGAVQAQDYPAAKWGLGLRAPKLTDADVDRAFDEGAILRTHIMRPTWHFVAPSDIRWLLALTGPRVHAFCRHYYRKLELEGLFARSRSTIERALAGGNCLTRAELGAALQRTGISASGNRLAFLMMHAELDAVICSGPRRGKQFTYALVEERAPGVKARSREDALVELTRRYFTSHGPATVRDFVWWSGLTVREVRSGLEAVSPALEKLEFRGKTYWFVEAKARTPALPSSAHLLPNYDEYLIAYQDRDEIVTRGEDRFAHSIVIDGKLAGSWKRTMKNGTALVEVAPYRRLHGTAARVVEEAAERFGKFVGMAVKLSGGV